MMINQYQDQRDMELRIGDRFQCKGFNPPLASILEIISERELIVLEGPEKGKTFDDLCSWYLHDNGYYKYLGNFSKSTNFNNLYQILCS